MHTWCFLISQGDCHTHCLAAEFTKWLKPKMEKIFILITKIQNSNRDIFNIIYLSMLQTPNMYTLHTKPVHSPAKKLIQIPKKYLQTEEFWTALVQGKVMFILTPSVPRVGFFPKKQPVIVVFKNLMKHWMNISTRNQCVFLQGNTIYFVPVIVSLPHVVFDTENKAVLRK